MNTFIDYTFIQKIPIAALITVTNNVHQKTHQMRQMEISPFKLCLYISPTEWFSSMTSGHGIMI